MILLFEDNPADALLLSRKIKQLCGEDVDILVLPSIGDIKTIRAGRPDVVFVDPKLIDSEGTDTVRQVVNAFPGVTVIVTTGGEMKSDEWKKEGVKEVLSKDMILRNEEMAVDALTRALAGLGRALRNGHSSSG